MLSPMTDFERDIIGTGKNGGISTMVLSARGMLRFSPPAIDVAP